MTGQTQVNIDQINLAEAKIAHAIQAVKSAVDQLNAHTREFCGAAGSNEKNGNLQQQSETDQENKNKQCADTSDAAGKDQAAARSAAGQYAAAEGGNAAALHGLHVERFGRLGCFGLRGERRQRVGDGDSDGRSREQRHECGPSLDPAQR